MSAVSTDPFDALNEVQKTALMVAAKTRHFLDGSPGGENKREAILAYAQRMAREPQVVERITQAYLAKQERRRDPLSVLGSFPL